MKTNLKITVNHSAGLHARPASLFVQTANKFTSNISVQNITQDSPVSNAKSILSVLTLGVIQGHEIEIIAEGDDAEKAIIALESLIKENFGEE
jgi:phosphotransferase system HPr (HPr) family protein